MNESIGKYMRSALRAAPLIMATGGLTGCGKAVVECGTPSALVEEFNTKAAQALIQTSDDISKGKPTGLLSGELAFIQDTQDGTHIVAGASFDPGEGGGGIYKEANRQVLTYASDATISITYAYGLSLYNFAGGSVHAEKDFHPDSLELWNHTYKGEKSESFFRLTIGQDGVPYIAQANNWSVSTDADKESDKWDQTEELCMPVYDVLLNNADTSSVQMEQYAKDEMESN